MPRIKSTTLLLIMVDIRNIVNRLSNVTQIGIEA